MDNTNGGSDGCAIHMSLQGKGGVGKSLAASVLAQYFMARGKPVHCIDADPVNKTLFQYRALESQASSTASGRRHRLPHVRSVDGGTANRGRTLHCDNGTSTFVPLWHYMLENDVPQILRSGGKKLYIHTVI